MANWYIGRLASGGWRMEGRVEKVETKLEGQRGQWCILASKAMEEARGVEVHEVLDF